MTTITDNVWDMFDLSTDTETTRAAGRYELHVSTAASDDPALRTKRDETVLRLKNLEYRGKIPGFNIWEKEWDRYISSGHHTNRGGAGKRAIEMHEKFRRWAGYAGVTLAPHFQNNVYFDSGSGPYHQFPDLCLVVYKSGFDIEAVFPHFNGEREYTIEDYLRSVEDDRPWRDWSRNETLQHVDHGVHGAIKAHVLAHSDELFGPEWYLVQDEQKVAARPDALGGGFIDLLFSNGEYQFLIVEAKSDPYSVDKAFGQARGYAIQFAEFAGCPVDDIELVIAAPEFHEYQRQIGEEWGFRLIETPVPY